MTIINELDERCPKCGGWNTRPFFCAAHGDTRKLRRAEANDAEGTANTDGDTENEVAVDEHSAADNEGDKTDELHAPSILGTGAATAERFEARLRVELAKRGIDPADLPRLIADEKVPPCYKLAGANYKEWLAAASMLGATVPYRFDMPAVPNYCWDCTPAYKQRAVAAAACKFPHTKFEQRRTITREAKGKVIEMEVVGVSRRDDVCLADPVDFDAPI